MRRCFTVPSVLVCAALAFGFGAATLSSGAFAQDAAAAAQQRSEIMKFVASTTKELDGAARAGQAGAAEAAKAAELQTRIKRFLTLFPQGSGSDAVKTRAKPEIWAEWPKFEATGKTFLAALGEVEAAAKAGDQAAMAGAVKKAQGVCATCHRAYRGPQP